MNNKAPTTTMPRLATSFSTLLSSSCKPLIVRACPDSRFKNTRQSFGPFADRMW
jgi:hypothetical protein